MAFCVASSLCSSTTAPVSLSLRTLAQLPVARGRIAEFTHSGVQSGKAQAPSFAACVNRLAQLPCHEMEREVDKQVAVLAATRIPNWHRAKKAITKSADARVATVRNSARGKTLSNEKQNESYLTPTGLLMEGDFTQNPQPMKIHLIGVRLSFWGQLDEICSHSVSDLHAR